MFPAWLLALRLCMCTSIQINFLCIYRFWIITLHFTNCNVNSSYCDSNVVNHEKNVKQFFPKENLIHPNYIFHVISKWYPHFIHPLHTITKWSIAYTQNYIAKYKKCFSILKRTFACSELKASLRSEYLLQSEFQTIIRKLLLQSKMPIDSVKIR